MTEASKTVKSQDNSLTAFIRYLIRKWWLFLLIGVLAGLAGIYYAAEQKLKYESRVTFVLDQGSGEGGVSSAVSLAAQFGLNIGSGDNLFAGDNIIEVIKSRRIIEKVLLSVDTFNRKPYTLIEYMLHAAPGSNNDKEEGEAIHFYPNQANLTYQQDSVLYETYMDFAKSHIKAERPDKKLNIFRINVSSTDEHLAKVFTDKLLYETDIFYTEICSKKERETLEILENRVGSMRGNLSSSISSRASSQDANVNPAFASGQVQQQKQQANIQVYGAAYAELFKNLELARFQYLKKKPLILVIDPAEYPMRKIKVGKLKTGLIFSFAAVFLTVLVLWLIRIYRVAK